MNKETFNDLLVNAELLKNTSSADLFDVVKEFPYCQTSRILLTMRLHQENHFKYDAELKKTALYAGNRGMLKKHIDSLSYVVEDTEDIEEVETIHEKEVETDTVAASEDEKPAETDEQIALGTTNSAEESDKEVEASAVIEVADSEKLAEAVEETQEEEFIPEDSIEDTTETAAPAEEIQETTKARPPKRKKKTAEDERLAHLKSIVEARLKQIELERQHTSSTSQPEEITEARETLKAEKITKPKNKEASVDHLIDRFIKNQPKISRPTATFFNPAEAAKESVMDDEGIVSETLARIYFDQRYFEKAIKIYKKLSLIYPEKSTYFAAQIEKAIEELKK